MSLQDFVREARARRGFTQARVADLIEEIPGAARTDGGLDGGAISKIERGEVIPSPDMLVDLYQVLVGDDPDDPFWRWCLAWLDQKAQREGKRETSRVAIRQELAQLEERLARGRPTPRATRPWTLADFPFNGPLTVVLGDRRESEPKTRGDLFAYPMSTLDVQWLLNLGLGPDVSIVSDKLFAIMGEKWLREKFGQSHLLIVGSPAVNLAARRINRRSVFRFVVLPRVRQFQDNLGDLDARFGANKAFLRTFWHVVTNRGHADRKELLRSNLLTNVQAPESSTRGQLTSDEVSELEIAVQDLMKGQTVKYWMNEMRGQGIIDPADLVVRATATQPNNDFGLVSLAEHPFADETSRAVRFVAVMAAGIHGPGTNHAVQMLAEPQGSFADRPFGCVFELKDIDPDRYDWASRIAMADRRFETSAYTPGEMLDQLIGSGETAAKRGLAFDSLIEDEIQQLRIFVENLAQNSAGHVPELARM